MREHFPIMIDRPDTGNIIAGVFYGFLCFVSLPFILLLLMQGSFNDPSVIAWCDIAYHICNFLVAIMIFRGYLADSFEIMLSDVKRFLRICAICTGLIIAVAAGAFLHGHSSLSSPAAYLAAFGTLPIAELELFNLPSNLIYVNPLYGTLCIILLCPFATSCLFYTTGFAPVCNKHPWLGYLVVALLLAVPRFCNGATWWDPTEEFRLYFSQLPIHWISCWAYQKTDTVWTPIVSHMAVNLVSSLLLLFFYSMAT